MRSLIGFTLLVASPLVAQTNAERMLNDRYSRSHDYDLVHQRIELRGFDWDSSSFDGVVTTTIRSLRAGLDSVVLDAGELLEFGVVEAVNKGGPGTTTLVSLRRPARSACLGSMSPFHHAVQMGLGLGHQR